MTPTRICILCDNCSLNPDFGHEHGLSMCLDMKDGCRWLWDTGQSGQFIDNARAMGIGMDSFQGLALSHGHYDHTGGLAALLQAGFTGPIHAHEGFCLQRWRMRSDGTLKELGLNASPLSTPVPTPLPNFSPAPRRSQLHPGLTMLTDIPRREGLFQSVEGFYLDKALTIPDPVADDACLVLETSAGPVVVLGCCHSGLANTLYQVRDLMGLNSIHAVIGGFHLLSAPDNAVQETVRVLEEFEVKRIMPCHCTGQSATQVLARALGDRVQPLSAGSIIEF